MTHRTDCRCDYDGPPSFPARTTVTDTGDRRTTDSETRPSSPREVPVRPWLPTKTWSTGSSSTFRTIARAGLPMAFAVSTVTPSEIASPSDSEQASAFSRSFRNSSTSR